MKTWKLVTLGAFALAAASTSAWAQGTPPAKATGPMGLGPNYSGMLGQGQMGPGPGMEQGATTKPAMHHRKMRYHRKRHH
jgi:hypothetical protein